MDFLMVKGIGLKGDDGFALKNITFEQKKYQRIAVAGETGAGKTSLLKVIAGLFQPDKGTIKFLGKKVEGPIDKLVPGHPEIAYLSQLFELAKFLRVEQVLEYANSIREEEASAIYKICQIDHLLQRKTDQLSGGERQRIALAKLLITSPKLLLLDEPFSHLDPVHKDTLKSVISDVSRKLKITCILVSHDPGDTLAWADKMILLKDGAVIQQGSPQQVYKKPVNEYAAGLLGHYSTLSNEHAEALGYKKRKGKRILTRPESFRIVTRGRDTLAGVVEEVRFTGSQRELVVRVGEDILRASGDGKVMKRGDKIKLSLQDLPYWIQVS